MRVSGGIAGDLPSRSPSKNSAETDDEADPPAPAPATVGGRKKAAAGVRAWLAVNSAGEARMVEAGKHAIMRRTGLLARDLRILDPQLSYPSTVLGRERAIVINLEHIKAVITAHEVLVLNSRDPTVSPFVHQLQRRLNLRHGHQIEGGGGESGDGSHAYALEEIRASRSHFENYENLDYSEEDEGKAEMEEGKWKEGGVLANSNGPKALPFELIALEACLEAACSCLELEVRDELEHLLDDDEDMVEMYLTNKYLQQQQSNGSPQSCQLDQDSSFNAERIPAEISSDENDMESHNYTVISGSSLALRDGHESHTFSIRTSSKYLDVEDLEMLLEAYFVQIDSTLNNLSTLREYVDDTEDYINIILDDKQNHLLQMGVVLTAATLIVSAFVVLVAIFGMNIKVDLFDEKKAGTAEFVWTVGGGATGSLLLYVVAVSWCKHKGLLD